MYDKTRQKCWIKSLWTIVNTRIFVTDTCISFQILTDTFIFLVDKIYKKLWFDGIIILDKIIVGDDIHE